MLDFDIPESLKTRVAFRLRFLYRDKYSEKMLEQFLHLIESHKKGSNKLYEKWNQKDVILITYGDSIIKESNKGLESLYDFIRELNGVFSILHILPFFPYSSDDGFSVTDYYAVDPKLGDWSDIAKLNREIDLMIDLVINHISAKSNWFQSYLNENPEFEDFFIAIDPEEDLKKVVRPRNTPLLTPYKSKNGRKYLWSTFSSDQIDLNFSNPKVLIKMTDLLLYYIEKGARIIRLDAIAYLWKKIGTPCIHLPETHEVVKLFRDILDYLYPRTILLTETNVPNDENLSYFGEKDEAQMVYQFSLPPLLLHALYSGNSKYLSQWAQTIPDPAPDGTYFNFTASHDGIGVRPLEGLMPKEEKMEMMNKMVEFGGHISTKTNKDGTESPYEINITYLDALKGTSKGEDGLQTSRFLCSQLIMLELKGIPAVYIHSLTGTPNDEQGAKATGRPRSINRKKWKWNELKTHLTENKQAGIVFNELQKIIALRKMQPAFHPDAKQSVTFVQDEVFAVRREAKDENQVIVCISNIHDQSLEIDLPSYIKPKFIWKDLLKGVEFNLKISNSYSMDPYETLWLEQQ